MGFLGKLKQSFAIPKPPSLDAPEGVTRPKVFFEIEIGGQHAGRIEMELFSDITPKTAENFVQLAKNAAEYQGHPIGYQGSIFHRVPEFMIQGGDIIRGNGTGMFSIYGGAFPDENFAVKHTQAGLLSMANSGPGTNGCQFFITVDSAPYLDGKHVVFGRVTSGMQAVRAIEEIPTDASSRPCKKAVIAASGVC